VPRLSPPRRLPVAFSRSLPNSRVKTKAALSAPSRIAIQARRRGAKPAHRAIEDRMAIVVQKLTAVPKRAARMVAGPTIAHRSRVVAKAVALEAVALEAEALEAVEHAAALVLVVRNLVLPPRPWLARIMTMAFLRRLMNALPAWSTSSMRFCTNCMPFAVSINTSDRCHSALKAAMVRTEWPAAWQARLTGRKGHNPAASARLAVHRAGRARAARRANGTARRPRAAIERAAAIATTMTTMTDPAAAIATAATNRP